MKTFTKYFLFYILAVHVKIFFTCIFGHTGLQCSIRANRLWITNWRKMFLFINIILLMNSLYTHFYSGKNVVYIYIFYKPYLDDILAYRNFWYKFQSVPNSIRAESDNCVEQLWWLWKILKRKSEYLIIFLTTFKFQVFQIIHTSQNHLQL